MTTLVRSASLTSFAEIAAQCRLDARALLAEAGLPAHCLGEPDLMVPAAAVMRLLETAAERGREPAFGLRMAQSRRLSNLGPLGLLVRDEPTLRKALEALATHLHVHNEALAVRIEQVGNLVALHLVPLVEGGAPVRQAIELSVGVTFRVLRIFLGADWRPRLVCFSHRAPRSLAVHRQVLGDAVEFGHEFCGIVCNARDLDAPNPGADPVMARYAQRVLQPRAASRTPMSDRVRQLVVVLLPRGHCRADAVAQHLGVDRRTVTRHLAAEGTSFGALVDALRRDLLARYLKEGSTPLREISAMLGFSAQSAFARWHRQQFGMAARERLRPPGVKSVANR
jgi:AraC-like DNA-binding protein